MLKGTENGILIVINDIDKDLKELSAKLKTRMFITKIDFFIKEKDQKYFDIIQELLAVYKFDLKISKEKEKKITVVKKQTKEQNVIYIEKKIEKNETLKIKNLIEKVDDKAIIYKKTLRSGQKIEHNGDITIIGDVNAGAEVIASGSVYILGKALGTIHVGNLGDKTAEIICLDLKNPQIIISNIYTENKKAKSKKSGFKKLTLNKKDELVIEIVSF